MKNEIIDILSNAGWYPDRKIEIDYIIEDLRREHLTIPNDKIEKLFKEYWNLGIDFQTSDGMTGNIYLNVDRAIEFLDSKLLTTLEKIVNDKLVPAGTIQFDVAVFLISHSGKFYSLYEGTIYLLGNTFTEFLEGVILDKEMFKVGSLRS